MVGYYAVNINLYASGIGREVNNNTKRFFEQAVRFFAYERVIVKVKAVQNFFCGRFEYKPAVRVRGLLG